MTIRRANGDTVETAFNLRLYNGRERGSFALGGLLPLVFRGFLGKAA
ncbi:hypothetical protein [Paracoccus sp. (in: a-proteobacteria)]